MIENFQLAAIVRQGAKTKLVRIPLHQELQDTLAQTWQEQYDAFIDDVQEIEFNAGYQPEAHERFYLTGYALPHWLEGQDSQSAADLDDLTQKDGQLDAIRGLLAFARDDSGRELILFQNFNRSHVIRPGRFLFLQNNTYAGKNHIQLVERQGNLSRGNMCAQGKTV